MCKTSDINVQKMQDSVPAKNSDKTEKDWCVDKKVKDDKEKEWCVAMDRYLVKDFDNSLLGEGAFSMVWKAYDLKEKKEVALKTYKQPEDEEEELDCLERFTRQIEVLKFLQKPLEENEVDKDQWHPMLGTEESFSLKLLDYSQDADGKPCPYSDGQCYVVTEIADYSLKDLIRTRRHEQKPLSDDEIKFIATSIVSCVATLHAKKLVHCDFKAENFMCCKGKWKLIDLDGACSSNHKLSPEDCSVSYSPAYCPPEFAHFAIASSRGEKESLTIKPSIDVWSMGLTLCELVTLKPVLNKLNNEIPNAASLKSGCAILLWLKNKCPDQFPLPSALKERTPDLFAVLNKVLVRDAAKRLTSVQLLELVQCL